MCVYKGDTQTRNVLTHKTLGTNAFVCFILQQYRLYMSNVMTGTAHPNGCKCKEDVLETLKVHRSLSQSLLRIVLK